jgi:uncharacterized protein (TIGR04255 family)
MSKMCDEIKADYPIRAEVQEAKFQLGPAANTSSAQRHIGYKLDSQDDKQITQVRLDTFVFSRLAPYDRWETFHAEARRLWQIYSGLFTPKIKRVGVRYINRIDIPSSIPGGVDLDDYFLTAPKITPALPQSMSNYFMRLQIPMSNGVTLVITQTGVPPPDQAFVSSLLDIDVSVQGEKLDESSAWERINSLRDVKNMVFESCITNRVRELIN